MKQPLSIEKAAVEWRNAVVEHQRQSAEVNANKDLNLKGLLHFTQETYNAKVRAENALLASVNALYPRLDWEAISAHADDLITNTTGVCPSPVPLYELPESEEEALQRAFLTHAALYHFRLVTTLEELMQCCVRLRENPLLAGEPTLRREMAYAFGFLSPLSRALGLLVKVKTRPYGINNLEEMKHALLRFGTATPDDLARLDGGCECGCHARSEDQL